MKFSFAAIVPLLASVAYSQTIAGEVAQIPSCALSCLTTAITGAGCGLTDYACQCGTSKDAITKAATPCVVSSCSTTDALKVQSVVGEICTIQAASGGGSSSAAASVASSSTPTATTYAATSPTTSDVSMIGSFATSATSAAAGVTTTAASSPSASTSAPAQVTASPGNRLQVGGLLAGAAALLAFVL